MNSTTKFFFKIAIRTGGLFGLFMGLMLILMASTTLPFFPNALLFGIGLGLFAGLLFGVLFALIISIAQVRGLKKIGETEFTEETLSVVQRKIIQTSKTLADIITELQESDIFKDIQVVVPNKKITLKSNISLKSWGEYISITLQETKDNQNFFELLSKPKLKGTLADYGKNRQNILTLESILVDSDDLSQHLVN